MQIDVRPPGSDAIQNSAGRSTEEGERRNLFVTGLPALFFVISLVGLDQISRWVEAHLLRNYNHALLREMQQQQLLRRGI